MDLYGKAMLLMALQRGGQPEAATLVTELSSAAIAGATGTHWEEKRPDYWGMNTNTRTTAWSSWPWAAPTQRTCTWSTRSAG